MADSLAARPQSDSNDAVSHFEFRRALLQNCRFDEAEQSLHAAVGLAPRYAEACRQLDALP